MSSQHTGSQGGFDRSPNHSLVPPAIPQGVQSASVVLSPPAPKNQDALSRTWSFPGPSRATSPSVRTSPRRMTSGVTNPTVAVPYPDRLVRSWAFRPSASQLGQARSLSESFEGITVAVASATPPPPGASRTACSITLPVCSPSSAKDLSCSWRPSECGEHLDYAEVERSLSEIDHSFRQIHSFQPASRLDQHSPAAHSGSSSHAPAKARQDSFRPKSSAGAPRGSAKVRQVHSHSFQPKYEPASRGSAQTRQAQSWQPLTHQQPSQSRASSARVLLPDGQRSQTMINATSMTGVALLRAALSLTEPDACIETASSSAAKVEDSTAKPEASCPAKPEVCPTSNDRQPEARPASVSIPRFVSSGEVARPKTPSPLSPSEGGRPTRTEEPVVVQSTRCPDVEENKDPNTTVMLNGAAWMDADTASSQKSKMGKTPPLSTRAGTGTNASSENVEPATKARPPPLVVSADTELSQRGSSPRFQQNRGFDKSVASPEEIWLRLDSLRVMMDMLPGGLVIERDTNLSELIGLMAEMQSIAMDKPGVQAKHAQIFGKIQRISDLVESVEAEYWKWCKDTDAFPQDNVAKQQVYDWLVPTGEKVIILSQLQDLGARHCPGPSMAQLPDQQPAERPPCNKFLQYGLYKSKVQRCPACGKESKKLVAECATRMVKNSPVEVADTTFEIVADVKMVNFIDAPPTSIAVEAREVSFAKYAGCPNTYFRAFVLPSDLEIAKERGNPVMVSWLDGDRKHRSVPTSDVFLTDHPFASEVNSCNAAEWCTDAERLVARSTGR
jgi:hypothetical protein